MLLQELHQLILERNAVETDPFVMVHEANSTLLKRVDGLQNKCDALQRENAALDHEAAGSSNGGTATGAALRNETRLRDKLENLQEELNKKLKLHQKDTARALDTANALAQIKESHSSLEQKIKKLEQNMEKKEKSMSRLQQQLDDAQATTKLAEKQYMGLKETIRSLQSENDVLKKENSGLIDRIIGSKEKTSDEFNVLNEMVDKLKKEVEMLRTLKVQDDKRREWFGGRTKPNDVDLKAEEEKKAKAARKFGTTGSTVPSGIQHLVKAHSDDAMCVRYDSTGDMLATCGTDSTVKIWESNSGSLQATLRGAHSITACDIGGGLAVGGGSDKMCRVWNIKTERMIHQLVGHANKITCVRLFGNERAVITGSADRSLKVWDISRKTYRQTTTLRHGSTCYSVDVASDSFTTVSGHMDGGLRFWDVRTGERTADMEGLHDGSITSVQFSPTTATQVLTNGKDNCLKLIDMRTGKTINTMKDDSFFTTYNWSSAAISPDGHYATSVSGNEGELFVWNLLDGSLVRKLKGHEVGAGGVAWGDGGSSGQQVSSVDRNGKLLMWA